MFSIHRNLFLAFEKGLNLQNHSSSGSLHPVKEQWKGTMEQVKEQWNRWKCLLPPHPLTNFDIQKYYENEPKFNGVYSRNN